MNSVATLGTSCSSKAASNAQIKYVFAHGQSVITCPSLHALFLLQAALHFCLATICMTNHAQMSNNVQCCAEVDMSDSFSSKLHHSAELRHQHLLTDTKRLDNDAKSFAPLSEPAAHLTDLCLLAPSPAAAPNPAKTQSNKVYMQAKGTQSHINCRFLPCTHVCVLHQH